jgi:hypothetical protein
VAARKSTDARLPPVVRYAPIGELRIYEISEAELEKLETGPPGQLNLNFALALLPVALTVLITVQTVEIKNVRIYHGYWIAFWIFSVQGVAFLARWWRAHGSLKSLVQDIRSRMPEKLGTAEQETTVAQAPDP